MNELRVFAVLARASLRAQWQYRFNFLFGTVLSIVNTIAEFATVALILHRFKTISGWDVYEVGYLYGVVFVCRYLYRMIGSEINAFEKYVVEGLLDPILTRPCSILVNVMARRFRVTIGDLSQAVVVLSICIAELVTRHRLPGFTTVAWTCYIILTGTAITFSIALATASAAFWIGRIDDLQVLTDNASTTASQYPLTLFPNWLRTTLVTAVPMGFVAYVPALYVVRHAMSVSVMGIVTLAAITALAVALLVWKEGLSRYQSSGT